MKAPPNRILVRQTAAEDKIGAIFLPDSAKVYPPIGVVLSVGRDITDPEIVPGARVYFLRRPHGPTGGCLLPDNRESDPEGFKDILCLHQDDLLATVED